MASLSYQEKSLYGSLAAELLVYIPYFVLHRQNSLNKVVGMIVSIIVLQILLQSIIAALTRHRVRDERDQVIELRGYRVGYVTLVSLMIVGLGALWLHVTYGQLQLDSRFMGLHFLSVFFGMVVLSNLAKTVAQLVAYRRAL